MTKRRSLLAVLSFTAVLLCAIFVAGILLSGGRLTARAADNVTPVSPVEATVTVPVAGQTPNDITVTVSGDTYKSSGVTWYKGTDLTGTKMNIYSKFAEGQSYTVAIRFQITSISSEYAFDSETVVVMINGRSATIQPTEGKYVKLLTAYITLTAEGEPVPEHSVTLENGTVNGNTGGMFKEGALVTVTADEAPAGKVFYEWVVTEGEDVFFADENSPTTTFEMGEGDVRIKAVYKTPIPRVDVFFDYPIAGVPISREAFSYPDGRGYTVTFEWKKQKNGSWSLPDAGELFVLGDDYLAFFEVAADDEYFLTDETEVYANGIEGSVFDRFRRSLEVREIYTAAEKAPVYLDLKIGGGVAEITVIDEEDGSADKTKAEKAFPGDLITITADTSGGKLFKKWVVVAGDVTLADENAPTTTFTMPNGNVEITATYQDPPHVHDYGALIPKREATCSAAGMEAHYECSGCHGLFDESKVEKTADELAIAIDPDAHDPETGWTSVKDGHYHICKNGCTAGHDAMQAHTPDRAAATETDPVRCTVCGYTITPVVGHTHHLTFAPGEEATCIKAGTKSHYACDGCEAKFEDEAGTREITDESRLVIPRAHRFGGWIDEVPATTEAAGTKAHKDCEFCGKHFDEHGHEIEDLTIAKLPGGGEDRPGADEPGGKTTPTENKGLSGGAIAGIAAGSAVVVGVGGFAIFWFVIRKRSFADLIAVFRKG